MFSFKTRLFFLKIIARSLILEIIIQPKANFKSTFFGGFFMYTIGQVSKATGLPVSTLRYYDKEGLFPHLERKGYVRKFSDTELEEVKIIECLKRSGLEIKDIRQFFQWVSEGSSTYEKRRELFVNQKKVIQQEIESLEKTMAMLEFKCWYYDKAHE